MTDRTYECPSPDDCPLEADSAGDLAAHINTEHAGEYQRPDWPDTLLAGPGGCLRNQTNPKPTRTSS